MVVIQEAAIRLPKQFRRGVQIPIGEAHIRMAHVSGEHRESGIDVAPLTVPLQKAMAGEGMPQTMRRGVVPTAPANAASAHDTLEVAFGGSLRQSLSAAIDEQG